ncbi:uncharacterized protein [Spinacia oleracea]|uniref:RNase H type-1 domain-containing protein n=1 Tax=Spinacia oleracea TaxID=3562 RepID=A0ABM3RSC5_SPIOL|nr:uncharacterized protein LOC130472101 [Spinacia oleracea]
MTGISPDVITHKLNVNPNFKPVKQKRRKFSPERNKIIDEKVQKLIDSGKIREVKYPDWLANVVVVGKKNGKWRVCIDFTDINKACPKDPFPLPHIDAMVDATAGHELLTFMDAYSGYNQILMHPEDQEKTSFVTDRGIYCYKVMPFGLKNAGATYQRLGNKMVKDQLGDTMEVYIDDMLVKSKKANDHVEHLRQSFEILRKYGMKLNPTKFSFGVSAGKFLGYIVTQRGIEASPDQIRAIINIQSPRNIKESKPKEGEVLQLYLAFSTTAVSAVLAREDKKQQLPIYYISKSLLEAETRPELTGRMEKWTMALGGFDIKYQPRTAVKSQALADFVADFSPDLEKIADDEVKLINNIEETWTLFVDGSSNFRGAGLGVVLKSPQGDMITQAICCDFKATNNEAEYEALIAGMTLAEELGAIGLNTFSDSQLIVNQINGDYEAKDLKMTLYLEKAKKLTSKFRPFSIKQVPRNLNTQADALANLGSALRKSPFSTIPLVHLLSPAIEKDIPHHASLVMTTTNTDSWTKPILDYLTHETLPDDKLEARKILFKASRYVILQDVLFKRSANGMLMRCAEKAEWEGLLKQ